MGVDYSASAVIGCKVDPKPFIVVNKYRKCNHDVPETAKFCPVCGEKVWETYNASMEEEEGLLWGNTPKEEGFTVQWGTDYKWAYVGLAACETRDSGWGGMGDAKADVIPAPDLKDLTRRVLEPLGLWDEETYGLWAVLYCSY